MLVIKCLFWASVLTFQLDITVIMAVSNTPYGTAYACDGKMLKIECSEGFVINLIRANYGRYSITVCNDQGSTEWSVNCMSHKSFNILQSRCEQKRNCSIQANTSLFGDPCPGTVKYLEAHYLCVSATSSPSTHRPAPPWLLTSQPNVWNTAKSLAVFPDIAAPATPSSSTTSSTTAKISSNGLEKDEDNNSSWLSPNTFPPSAQVTSESDGIALQTTSESQLLSTSTENNNPWLLNDEKLPVCKPKNVRNLFWNYTNGGDISIQPCPGGASGIARWRCQAISKNVAIRFPDTPDLSDCKSVWLTSLNSRIMDGDAITKIASDLSQVTESKTLYGGDVIITCKLIRDMVQKMSKDIPTFADPRQREAVVFDLLRSVVQIGSHLLDSNTLASWHDLAYREQMQMASSLLVGLEENSFLLATTLSKERTITHCEKNIVLQVQVLETRNVADKIFPMSLSTECRIKSSNYVQLQKTSLLENSELGIVRVLYIAFDSLENILRTTQSSIGKDEKRINSKVLSASLGRGRHIQLNQPVTLCFEHLQTENVSNPSCVFWDYTQNMWSEEGCMLMSTNKTHTTCQCNHLTNFAVLVDVKSFNSITSNDYSLLYATLFALLVALITIIILFLVYRYMKNMKVRKEYGSFVQEGLWISKCFACCSEGPSSPSSNDPEKTLNCKDQRPTLYGNPILSQTMNVNAPASVEEITIQPTHTHLSNTLPRSFISENGAIDNHYPTHAKINHYPTYNRNGSIRKIKEARRLEHIENALQHRNRKLSGTLRSSSPRSHTYSEIVSAAGSVGCRTAGDPVYEEIEREKEHFSQVSDISDEDGKRHSDMSRQSSKSYGDHRPLIPYGSGTISPDRRFHFGMDSAFRNQVMDVNGSRTVSVLDGQTVVCHLQQQPDYSTRMYHSNKAVNRFSPSHHY